MQTRLVATALALGLAAVTIAPSGPARGPATFTAPGSDTSWVARSVLYEVFVQDFSPSGDFRGVAEGLDRIQAVGANVVWLMPIHPIGSVNRKGSLGSPYAVRDYRAINPAYGDAEDFRALLRAVHARDMKLILDWVPDHTAPDHAWVRGHPEFYVRNERGEPSVPIDPGGKPTDWTDVVQLDYRNPEVRQAMIAALRYWLEEFGVDGFRMDVAGFLPHAFWREAVPAMRAAVSRRILLLAEADDLELHRIGFDLTYGWDSYRRLKEVWRGAPAASFIHAELAEIGAMPPGGMRMRFTTNHDETAWDAPPVALFRGPAGARAAFTAITLLPGRPLVYNGQEVESSQQLGLFEREPIAWDRPGAPDATAFYRRVLALARDDPAVRDGDLAAVPTSAPRDVIAYRRGNVVVLVNARSHAVRLTLRNTALEGARDLLSGRVHRGSVVSLPGYGRMVLRIRAAPPRCC
jgi:glycosidase